jgi:hypothetical protein
MREKHAPGIAQPLVETQGALGGFGLKVRGYVIDSYCHKNISSGGIQRQPKLCGTLIELLYPNPGLASMDAR